MSNRTVSPTLGFPAQVRRAFQRALLRDRGQAGEPRLGLHRHVAALSGGALGAQLVQAAAVPLLARLYAPTAFGVWLLVLSVAGIASAIGGMRYELAIVLCKDDRKAAHVIALQTITNIAVVAIIVVLLFLFRGEIAAVLGAPTLGQWLWAAPAVVLLTGADLAMTYGLVRNQQFARLGAYRITHAVLVVGTQVAFAAVYGGGGQGLILGGVLGHLGAMAITLGRLLPARSRWRLGLSWQELIAVGSEYRNFPLYMVPWTLVTMLRERGLVILVGVAASAHVVGLYSQAVRLVWIPTMLITGSINSVLFQRAAAADVVAEMAPLVRRLLTRLVVFATPGFVFLIWFATDIFALLLGPRWTDAGTYAALMAVPAYAMFLTGILGRLPDVIGRQRVVLLLEVVYSAVSILAFALTLWWLGDVRVAVGAFAAVSFIYQIAFGILVYRLCAFPLRDLLHVGATALALVAGSVVMLALLGQILPQIAAITLGAVVVGIYLAAALWSTGQWAVLARG